MQETEELDRKICKISVITFSQFTSKFSRSSLKFSILMGRRSILWSNIHTSHYEDILKNVGNLKVDEAHFYHTISPYGTHQRIGLPIFY